MIPWARAVAAIVRIELTSLLRTREVYTIGLLPAALYWPTILVLAGLALSFWTLDRKVAVPEHAAEAFADVSRATLRAVPLASPEAALARGEVDMAVLTWETGPEVRPAWVRATARAPTDRHDKLERFMKDAVRDDLDRAIVDAGGDPDTDRIVGTVHWRDHMVPLDTSLRVPARQALSVYLFFAVTLGLALLPARTTADRLHGALEAFAVTPTPPVLVHTVRIVLATVLVLALLAIPLLAGMSLSLGNAESLIGFTDLHPLDVVELVLVALLLHAVFVATSLLATSVRTALGSANATLSMLGAAPIALGFAVDLPALPLVGFVADAPVPVVLGRLGLTAALVAVALGVVHVLSRGPRALPPGERDE